MRARTSPRWLIAVALILASSACADDGDESSRPVASAGRPSCEETYAEADVRPERFVNSRIQGHYEIPAVHYCTEPQARRLLMASGFRQVLVDDGNLAFPAMYDSTRVVLWVANDGRVRSARVG